MFLALVSVECVWTHIYVGGVVLQAYSLYALTHSLLSISGFLCSHSLLLFLSLSFLSYVFVIHSSWGLHTEESNKGEASLIVGAVTASSSHIKSKKKNHFF